jgi:hypothetical protein
MNTIRVSPLQLPLKLIVASGLLHASTQCIFAEQAPDVAAAMIQRANLSFESVNDAGWPTHWLVREITRSGESKSLLLPKEASAASVAFSTDTSTSHAGTRSALITGDPGERCLIMGEEAFPLIAIRNYLKTDELRFELKGWIKGENATGQPKIALEFTKHSDPQYGWMESGGAVCKGGTYDWTLRTLKQKDTQGRWVRISCWAPGNTGKLWFDDFSLTINGIDAFELMARVREWRDGTTRNARLQASLPEAVIWTEDPAQKVLSWSPPPEGDPSPGIEISAAKGEYESLQVAIKPLKDLEGITVSFSDLKGPRPWYYFNFGAPVLKKENLESREVVLVNRAENWDFIDQTGMLPDPLLSRPSYSFKQGGTRSLWLTIQVPRETPAGEYTGTVTLGGAVTAVIPLKINVRDFALPEQTTFNLNAVMHPACIAVYDMRPWLEVMRDYFPDLASHRVRANNNGHFPIPVIKEGRLSLDPDSLAESDATIAYGKSLGFHTFTTADSPFYLGGVNERNGVWKTSAWSAQKFDTGIRRDSPEFPRLYGEYLSLTAAHFREQGTLDNVLAYIYDEPFLWAKTEEQKSEVNEVYKLSKEAGLRNLLTDKPRPEYHNIDVWCPIYCEGIGELASVRKSQAAGQKVDWYHNEFYTINRTTLNARLVPWFTWRYAFDGYLIWSVSYWAEGNPWERERLNGDGYLLYPNPDGPGKPASSIRWEMFREGIEDYDYFVLLKGLADAVLGNADSSPPERIAQAMAALKLLKEMETLIPEDSTTLKYNQDPASYSELRDRIAHAIEELGAQK